MLYSLNISKCDIYCRSIWPNDLEHNVSRVALSMHWMEIEYDFHQVQSRSLHFCKEYLIATKFKHTDKPDEVLTVSTHGLHRFDDIRYAAEQVEWFPLALLNCSYCSIAFFCLCSRIGSVCSCVVCVSSFRPPDFSRKGLKFYPSTFFSFFY